MQKRCVRHHRAHTRRHCLHAPNKARNRGMQGRIGGGARCNGKLRQKTHPLQTKPRATCARFGLPCDMRSLRFRLFAQSMTQAAPIVSNSSGIRHYAPAQWRSGSTAAWATPRDCRACATGGLGGSTQRPYVRGRRHERRSVCSICVSREPARLPPANPHSSRMPKDRGCPP